ncbi:TadE/TadG family type IV pilus assembly protein [Streptomyces sp. TRM68367]|uniref:TadE/TadG family type IV pilus assembly protein n=1 Tax=Streptomyces sp. TRM68367 TaxID=2758415 RepID=UPI00165BD0AD|nr:TadE/TadG family type IV pilus assembly protein [Streptomyces sp. TRM68367]MBC9731458.1 pilus assembly protein [Streptomyces sp. TRM68367]
MRDRLCGRERDRGDIAIEAVIVLPLLIALALVVIAGSRLSIAGQRTDAAAQAAARAASLARTPGAGNAAAQEAAEDSLASQQQGCTATDVAADTGGLAVPLGQVSSVTVTVSCTVPLGDLFFLGGGPGTRTVTSHFTSIVDAFRERG